jgi:hypothetical protein
MGMASKMTEGFTIRIYVPDGDPEGVRIIDRLNWTGIGLAFPRTKWKDISKRQEFGSVGVYILVGYKEQDDDLPTIYIGQGDGVKNRIDSHEKNKEFWDWCIVFTSTNNGLNRAHITWLEYALVNRANQTKRCYLENGNTPQEPALAESEKADTKAFFNEILQILPLVGLRAFEFPKAVAAPKTKSSRKPKPITSKDSRDTIVVPAKREGFERVFLGENCWYAIRISGGMLDKIKYIAAYQSQPVSAVTHYAPVDRIEPYGEGGKYKVIFSEKAAKLKSPIPLGNAPAGTMQGPRYTNLETLMNAKKVADLAI